MIYYFVFAISSICLLLAEKFEKIHKKYISNTFICISVLIPSLLAAFRTDDIGVDMTVYVHPVFSYASISESLVSLFDKLPHEKLYLLLNYIVSKTSSNFSFFLFLIECIILYFVVKSCWYFRNVISASLALYIYLCVYYGHTLNIVRQSIAMSIMMYSIIFLLEHKTVKFLVCIFIAVGFHTSSIICLSFWLIYRLLSSDSKKIWKGIIIVGIAVGSLFYDKVFTWLVINVSFLPKRYLSRGYIYNDGLNIPFTEMIYVLIFLLVAIWVSRKIRNDLNELLVFFASFSFFIILIASVAGFASRIGLYYQMFSIFALPQVLNVVKKKTMNFYLTRGLIILLAFAFFTKYFVVEKVCEIFPYQSVL